MATLKCLDTDFLIAILRGNREAKSKLDELDAEGRQSTTSINAFEVFHGAYRSRRKETNVKEAKVLIARLITLPLDEEASHIAGQTLAILEAEGKPVEFRDIFVGAIAIRHNLPIITRNVGHYTRIPKCIVEQW